MKVDINHSTGTDEVNFYRLKPPPPDVALAANGETLYAGIISNDDSLASHWHIAHNGEEKAVAKSKIPCNLTLSADSLILDENNLTQTITATWTGNGNLTVSSSNSNIASVSVSGNSVTLTGGKNTGIVAVVFMVNETSNYTSEMVQITGNVTTSAYKPLNECTPQEIQAAARRGVAPAWWNIGEYTYSFRLTGNAQTGADSAGYWSTDDGGRAKIIGFNHDAENSITFAYPSASQVDLGKGSSTAVYDLAFKSSSSTYKTACNKCCHHFTDSNNGGWGNSYIRKTILPRIFNVFPSDWKAVISIVPKYTDNTGGGNSGIYPTITMGDTSDSKIDKLFLLSEYEVFGRTYSATSYEKDFQKQYPFFDSFANRRRWWDTNPDSEKCTKWWLRSPNSNTTAGFCAVGEDIDPETAKASFSLGIVPCFVIS